MSGFPTTRRRRTEDVRSSLSRPPASLTQIILRAAVPKGSHRPVVGVIEAQEVLPWPTSPEQVHPCSSILNKFCQGRDHALFFRSASNLGASQSSTRSVNPGTNIQLMWPDGSRQIFGCCHSCHSSSIGCLSANKSWVPSINNMFSFGMTGLDRIRFNHSIRGITTRKPRAAASPRSSRPRKSEKQVKLNGRYNPHPYDRPGIKPSCMRLPSRTPFLEWEGRLRLCESAFPT